MEEKDRENERSEEAQTRLAQDREGAVEYRNQLKIQRREKWKTLGEKSNEKFIRENSSKEIRKEGEKILIN